MVDWAQSTNELTYLSPALTHCMWLWQTIWHHNYKTPIDRLVWSIVHPSSNYTRYVHKTSSVLNPTHPTLHPRSASHCIGHHHLNANTNFYCFNSTLWWPNCYLVPGNANTQSGTDPSGSSFDQTAGSPDIRCFVSHHSTASDMRCCLSSQHISSTSKVFYVTTVHRPTWDVLCHHSIVLDI